MDTSTHDDLTVAANEARRIGREEFCDFAEGYADAMGWLLRKVPIDDEVSEYADGAIEAARDFLAVLDNYEAMRGVWERLDALRED